MIILKDGTDQTVPMKFYKTDAFTVIDGGTSSDSPVSIEYTGSTNGESFTEATVTFHEYKKENVALSPSITWDESLHVWNVVIPASNFTQYGNCILTVQKEGTISPATVEFQTVSISDVYSSLNNISETQILSQVQSALNSYDPPTKAELDTAIDSIPTVSEIISAFDNEVVDGVYTRIQVERIITAVLIGLRTRVDGQDKFLGMDGVTTRLVTELSPNIRSIVSRDGD